ncbi:polysaccharide biosynthesis protein [Dysosmobacter sp.]|uniref:polysaccharide biosynthesis protein n=1 Tax=Dysosmobacter sp. TaxID=2591382 RepID=UPI003AB38039
MSRFRRQLLFLCDAFLFAVAVAGYKFITVLLPYTATGAEENFWANAALLYGCTVLAQMVFKTYDSLWRYAESREYLMLIASAFCGFAVYETIARLSGIGVISFVLLAAIASLWVLEMLVVRFGYRSYRARVLRNRQTGTIPVAIIGAGAAGVQLLNEIQHNPNSRYTVQCFFDDDAGKLNKRIRGVPVSGTISESLSRMRAMDIHDAIFAIPSMDDLHRREILRQLTDRSVRVSTLPSTLELIDRKPIRQQLREVRIEDLLGRDTIELDISAMEGLLSGRTVLVTGGGGSIGSELCRQIVKHHPKRLVIFDIYENNAYDIQQELLYQYGRELPLSVEIGSVRDPRRLELLFDTYKPDVVFHAAAHKHVPLMETSPQEAIRNNVFGTLNTVRAADAHGVKKFILISTDKAVNPTSVMGASKRLCEMVVQSMAGCSQTTFAAVRFGNVLGSNGSVVPLFRRQIAAGGPVTVTDKRIIRYFMTIPEAAQLVLEAGAMAKQNELFVLDMGRPVKIIELAENMIRLSGYEPYRDIEIVETGLRPGEKLYEELLIASRDLEKTVNGMIFVEHQPPVTPEELERKLTLLNDALEKTMRTEDVSCIREVLHRVVPTFHEPEEVNRTQGETVEIPEQEPACS